MEYQESEVPSLIRRLLQVRDLLLIEPQTFQSICRLEPTLYQAETSGQRAFRRDLHSLRALGYQLEIATKPKRWRIVATQHVIPDQELEALAAIRDLFGAGHPMAPKVSQLLDRLTTNLSDAQQKQWRQMPVMRVAFNPAIDYTPYTDWIEFFAQAIRQRRQVGFYYQARRHDQPQHYPRLDPYELEYRDRHYYLLAYCYRHGMILTFRLDRMIIDHSKELPYLRPGIQPMQRKRPTIDFTYRLPASFAPQGVSERFTIKAIRHLGEHIEIDASEFSEFQIIRPLLGYGEHAQLVSGPDSLFNELRRVVEAMYANYLHQSARERGE